MLLLFSIIQKLCLAEVQKQKFANKKFTEKMELNRSRPNGNNRVCMRFILAISSCC